MADVRLPRVAFSILGSTLDRGKGIARWERWRPTVALVCHEDLLLTRLELLYQPTCANLAQLVAEDVRHLSPETEVRLHSIDLKNPWDFEEVYGVLHDMVRAYPFVPEREEYLVHITTGTHVEQICLFLLTESRHLPAKLIQTSPPRRSTPGGPGTYAIIDLDLSRYDRLASRFQAEKRDNLTFLKSGIDTRNEAFNRLIERIEVVASASRAPILLEGPTGAGKSQLARRIFELKKARRQVQGELVDVNCATLRGDTAMTTLFGHTRGAFTGATSERQGLLRKADGGVLFLDEIGELGLDEQAMLLRAIEDKVFYPVGSDREVKSDFLLLAGTNRDLAARVAQGKFREDLLARIHIWKFRLPGLRERPEDIEPNLNYELEQASQQLGGQVTMNREARERYLAFAVDPSSRWSANFRDLNASVLRMATLARAGRISVEDVAEEIERLRASWALPAAEAESSQGAFAPAAQGEVDPVTAVLGEEQAAALDRFDRVQLAEVLQVCRSAPSLSAAGRILFAASRNRKVTPNDADRLRKYLARFGLSWGKIHSSR
ncbi:MAG: RNA repair transcriptional activator RtcR [Myxococcales bacterium]|nr:RNA repair transcriptional activator RtcR [Polyangiaceae bacterium]MDW8251803.1 RNA repair transcriptional activator RtcR [Myxococcales bacterium]